MSTCHRLPGSVWTNCPCDPCTTDRNRKVKLRRWGRPVAVDRRDEAWDRIEAWVRAGYSPLLIADLIGDGVPARTGEHFTEAVNEGRRHRITYRMAALILAAPDKPGRNHRGRVPAHGSTRRLRALTVMGWSMAELGARAGVDPDSLNKVRAGNHPTIGPKFAAIAEELYDELWDQRGPNTRAATAALRKGWLPPLAWDDIDDPDETPTVTDDRDEPDEVVVQRLVDGQRVTATWTERREAVRRLARAGVSHAETAERLGIAERTVARIRAAHTTTEKRTA